MLKILDEYAVNEGEGENEDPRWNELKKLLK
jgi:hypothetical protein